MMKFFFGSSRSSKANGNTGSQLSNDKEGHWDKPRLKNRVPENQSSTTTTPTLKNMKMLITLFIASIHQKALYIALVMPRLKWWTATLMGNRCNVSESQSSQTSQVLSGNSGGTRPPRVQYTTPVLADGVKQKPKSHSFREPKGSEQYFSTRDWVENGFEHDSPRKLAKHVIERLSQSHVLPRVRSKSCVSDVPITIEDIYGEPLIESLNTDSDGSHQRKVTTFLKRNCSRTKAENAEYIDMDLISKSKKAEALARILTEEFNEQKFLQGGGFTVPGLIQIINSLADDKLKMACEVSAFLNDRVVERASAREELKLVRIELDSTTRRLEKEKSDLQLTLEKELDRRSSEWSFKLEKFQTEEHRLRDRVRELAEQNVSLQIEVSAFREKDIKRSSEWSFKLEKFQTEEDRLRDGVRELAEQNVSLQREVSAFREKDIRRSSEWSFKLEKFQTEEHRLRDRVRELAEQNVSLQREVSAFREKDIDSKGRISSSEQQLQDQTARMEELGDENQSLQQHIIEIQEKFKAAQEDRDFIQRNYMEREKECKDLHKSITRMLRTCSEQEKTILGLREGLREEIRKKTFLDNFDSQLGKLQMELMRLTGTEPTLRNEVESYRREDDLLRHENINLLNRLKGTGKEDVPSVTIDQELLSRVFYLQNKGLLNECVQLCMTLLEHLKEKVGQSSDINRRFETFKNGLDGQFLIESDMTLHGFKRGAENLIRSLQNLSSLLQEKGYIVTAEPQSHSLIDRSGQTNDQNSNDDLRSELKAELLLTSLLRDKLRSQELDMEQLQAELAAAVRGKDILRCELQHAGDNLSSMNHKLKDLELQMIKKDESISYLRSDLQECTKELTIVKGILPKVSEERDEMWDEVKRYSEKSMLLNSEVAALTKKVETLDEDILLKQGQIAILKDGMGKHFELLGSPNLSD